MPNRDDWDHPWDGRALNLAHDSGIKGASPTSDLVHDIAHWLVAAPERRGESDFGLDRMAAFFTPEPGSPDDTEEEQHASLLGILLERTMGLDWRYTWEFHGWQGEALKDVRATIRALRHRGLLRVVVPTCLSDATSSSPHR